MIPAFTQRRRFADLSEQEILALAISSEEDDAQIYRTYAERLRAEYPASAAIFDGMAAEEDEHRRRLIAKHRERFGEFIPLIRREHVSGYYARRPVWLMENLGIERMREEAEGMERQAEAFYRQAAGRTSDAGTRALLGDLAAAEAVHTRKAGALEERHLDEDERTREERAAHRSARRTFRRKIARAAERQGAAPRDRPCTFEGKVVVSSTRPARRSGTRRPTGCLRCRTWSPARASTSIRPWPAPA